MSNSNNENGSVTFSGVDEVIDFGLVLVVGSSPVNRIVVSRIAERAGFRAVCQTPGEAHLSLSGRLPAMVIVDAGAQDRECEPLAERLVRLRHSVSGRLAPLVLLLGTGNAAAPQLCGRNVVDAVIAKPITPDRLQPVIRDMIDRLRSADHA